MDESQAVKGKRLMMDAERKLHTPSGFLSKLVGGRNNVEEAIDLYLQAVRLLKRARDWRTAGEACNRLARLEVRLRNHLEAANHYILAATLLKRVDRSEAVASYLSAIEIYTDRADFTTAAKQHLSIAELYAAQDYNIKKACSHYAKAAHYFKTSKSKNMAQKCFMKVAKYSAYLGHYKEAISLYEELACECMENNTFKYSIKDFFLRALLCHLCMDLSTTQVALYRYERFFPAFSESKECRLIKILLKACEDGSEEVFNEAVFEYENTTPLDSVMSSLLLNLKKAYNIHLILQ